MSNLATVLISKGDFAKALLLEQEAFEALQRQYGAGDPNTLASLHNLGAARLGLGEVEESVRLLNDALRRREQILGLNHPRTIETRNVLTRALGEHKGAEVQNEISEEAVR
jgi:tetratricopeptide (TPR) repeat protein